MAFTNEQINASKTLLALIDIYQSVTGKDKDERFIHALIIAGMPEEKATTVFRVVKGSVPKRELLANFVESTKGLTPIY